MLTYKIHIIRTGNTSANEKKRYVGRQDLPLCQNGIEMITTLRDQFFYPDVDMVYTSPLKRCIETAQIIYPDNQTISDNNFIDMDIGEFTGKTYDELEHNPDFVGWINNSKENSPPGGESAYAFTERLIAGLDRIYREMMNTGLQNVAIITHGSVIMSILSAVGIPKKPPYEWLVDNGIGYTLSMSAQLWMQGNAAEVLGYIPMLKENKD